jgi:hypothetical protein
MNQNFYELKKDSIVSEKNSFKIVGYEIFGNRVVAEGRYND